MSKDSRDLDSVIHSLENETDKAMHWFKINHMCANAEKFQAIILGRSNVRDGITFRLGDASIEPERSVKMLGVQVDNKLNFDSHIKEICRKAGNQINALARLSRVLNIDSKLAIFRSFVRANFTYCSLVWHNCGVRNSHKLEKLQERALRFVYLDFSSSYDELIRRADTTTLHLGRIHTLVTEVYKSINHLNPTYVQEMFSVKNVTHNFRSSQILNVPRVKSTTFGIHSLRYQGARLWNLLPEEYKKANTLKSFKSKIRSWPGEVCKCKVCRVSSCW
jgi:hypothetical protein